LSEKERVVLSMQLKQQAQAIEGYYDQTGETVLRAFYGFAEANARQREMEYLDGMKAKLQVGYEVGEHAHTRLQRYYGDSDFCRGPCGLLSRQICLASLALRAASGWLPALRSGSCVYRTTLARHTTTNHHQPPQQPLLAPPWLAPAVSGFS
jgi:hypothetical protein